MTVRVIYFGHRFTDAVWMCDVAICISLILIVGLALHMCLTVLENRGRQGVRMESGSVGWELVSQTLKSAAAASFIY